MPLSEEEQRILHEMEEKLYEHDRAFADRVSTKSPRHPHGHAGRGWVVAFIAGFVLLLVAFVHQVRQSDSPGFGALSGASRRAGVGEEWSEMRRRLRSRFGNRS
jgi:hypothetical protein